MHFDDWTHLPPEERVKKAISGLVLDHCFYGAIALHLEHKPDPTCDTLWVDGVTIGYNPEYVKSLSFPRLRFGQAHEYTHVANKHHIRRGDRDPYLYNVAADHVVNLMLKEAGFDLPDNVFCDPRFTGMAVEQVYAILDEERRQQNQQQQQESQDQLQEGNEEGSQPQGGSDGDSGPGEEETESDKEDGEGADDSDDAQEGQDHDTQVGKAEDQDSQEASEQEGAGGEGEGVEGDQSQECDGAGSESGQESQEGTGDAASQEGGSGSDRGKGATSDGGNGDPNAVGDVGECGEVRDAPDQSETGIKEEEAKWDIVLTQAAKLSERMGDMPASVKRIIDEVLDAKVHWEEALARWIVEQADTDYSWKRPNRRYLSQDIYLPSLQGDELMPIAFMVDTSGSQDRAAINQCGAEIQAALSTYFTEFTVPVIYCDSVVQGVDEIEAYDEVELNPLGGGGTDFRPPFKYIEDEQIEVEGAIYLTDGHCYRFPEEPDYPVLWVITPRGKRNFEPPFGEVISMND